ncbi:guanine nucleotide-binding protein G(I)/G(S)/G(O) subunit gamma-13-like [Scleropages formosus]|uniref:Guanine nucleotide-binding protein G(I)/G(S)/G(O) subunit gamma-13-like n=1 Tax=Scleropages formosus TaxID=113540 RepID=A0A0P7US44_SCLFO|nr:guanine nucleotide-binding protein G(I)/G(S)/G(O) subunit gamma-13-like [Scleropages formosus]
MKGYEAPYDPRSTNAQNSAPFRMRVEHDMRRGSPAVPLIETPNRQSSARPRTHTPFEVAATMDEMDLPQMKKEVESLKYQLAFKREKSSKTVTDLVKWIEDCVPEDPFLNPELMKNNPWLLELRWKNYHLTISSYHPTAVTARNTRFVFSTLLLLPVNVNTAKLPSALPLLPELPDVDVPADGIGHTLIEAEPHITVAHGSAHHELGIVLLLLPCNQEESAKAYINPPPTKRAIFVKSAQDCGALTLLDSSAVPTTTWLYKLMGTDLYIDLLVQQLVTRSWSAASNKLWELGQFGHHSKSDQSKACPGGLTCSGLRASRAASARLILSSSSSLAIICLAW